MSSIGAFAAILAVVWVSQAVTRIDFATGSGGAIGAFLTMMALLTPQFITLTLPFGLLIGAMSVLNAMNSDSEMPIVAGVGISRLTVARPLLILALVFGAVIALNNHVAEPAGNRAARDIIIDFRTDLLSSLITEGRFTRIERGLVIYIDERRPNGTLGGIMIADRREDNQHLIYYARQGVADEHNGEPVVLLNDGQIHRKDPVSGTISIIRFQSYAIGLSQFESATDTEQYMLHERSTPYLLDPDPNDRHVQRNPGQIRGELHRRFTEWLYPALFAAIALVMAGQPRSHRSGANTAMFLGFAGALGYRWAGYFAYNQVKGDGSLFWLLYAIPIAGLALGAFMFLTGRTVGLPDAAMSRLARWRETMRAARLRAMRNRSTA